MESERSQLAKILKGFFSLTAAKLVFMVAGLAVQFTLPRLLTPSEFGDYGVIIGLLNVFNMVLITGTIQAVSKFVSEREDLERSIRQTANRVQMMIGGAIFLILLLGAPIIAEFFNDSSLVSAIRCCAFVPLFYSFYAVSVGSLNGRKMFTHQAGLDITFATLKTTGILTMASLGLGVVGSICGFSLAAGVILGISLIMIARHQSPDIHASFPVKKLLSFEAWVMLITFLTNLLIHTDLFMVKSLLETETASVQAGYYYAVQNFARIPYTLVVAVSLVIFPLISKSTFDQDIDRTRTYIRTTLRMTLIFVMPLAIIFASMPETFLTFVYPDSYAAGAGALQILPIGEAIFALMLIAVTIITGSGHPRASCTIIGIALIAAAGACRVLIPQHIITGAAIGSSIGWTVGLILAGLYLFRKYGSFIPVLSFIRAATAGTAAYFTGVFIPLSGFTKIVVGSAGVVVVYFAVIFLTAEFGMSDIRGVLGTFSRKSESKGN